MLASQIVLPREGHPVARPRRCYSEVLLWLDASEFGMPAPPLPAPHSDRATASETSSDSARARRRKFRRRWIIGTSVTLAVGLPALLAAGWWHYRVAPLPWIAKTPLPQIRWQDGRTLVGMPNGNLVGEVGSYSDELTAYLRFDYLKGIQSIAGARLYLVTREEGGGPRYRLWVEMPNDVVAASHTLAGLAIAGRIDSFRLQSPPTSNSSSGRKKRSSSTLLTGSPFARD